MATLLALVAMAGLRLTHAAVKMDQVRTLALHKESALLNALDQVRIHQLPEDEYGEYESSPFRVNWQLDEAPLLRIDRIELEFEKQDRWPIATGLWVTGERFHLVIKDFRRE
jgi:hypothetical protein